VFTLLIGFARNLRIESRAGWGGGNCPPFALLRGDINAGAVFKASGYLLIPPQFLKSLHWLKVNEHTGYRPLASVIRASAKGDFGWIETPVLFFSF